MSDRIHVEVRPGAYADSVTLLQVSKQVAAAQGVETAQVAMATPLNVDLLTGLGFDVPAATANDMVVAIRIDEAGSLEAAVAAADQALAAASRSSHDAGAAEPAPSRTTGSALTRSGAGLALVSVPGESAFVEAMDAVDAGRDVMVFSDNVPLEQEVALKRAAERAGVLAMGPDCGTAMVAGLGLGFANAVRPGPVGIVAASGTGCQQVMSLLDSAGVGTSAALGVGGRDLSDEVGGLSTRQALRMLDADPSTELIVVVSKPPAPQVAAELEAFAATLDTPVQLALLGPGLPDLTAAVERVLATLNQPEPHWHTWGCATTETSAGWLRGLFVGGTLCDEAMLVAAEALGPIRSNIPLSPDLAVGDDLLAAAHVMIDFGDDAMTVGRAHPMIDPTLRLEQLARAAADSSTAVVLLDVVLGHGAQDDPARDLAPAIHDAIATATSTGRTLPVVVSCIGTERDPQPLGEQADQLAAAGAYVFASNAAAARHAAALITAERRS
jgi:FdrA protein